MSGWCWKLMESVAERQKREKPLRFSRIQGNCGMDRHGQKVIEKRWELRILFVFINPKSFWGKMLDESPLHSHSQLYPCDHQSSHTHGQSVREEALLFLLAADLHLSRGVRTSIRWDLFTVCCPVWTVSWRTFSPCWGWFWVWGSTEYWPWDQFWHVHEHALSR